MCSGCGSEVGSRIVIVGLFILWGHEFILEVFFLEKLLQWECSVCCYADKMITDVQLAIFANVLGVSLFLLVVLYHYISVNKPKKSDWWSSSMWYIAVLCGNWMIRFTVNPSHGRSAPPSWSIRPVEFEGRKDRGNGANRPRRCTRSFRPTRMSELNEVTCETISHTYFA